jgi:hypothetical protein
MIFLAQIIEIGLQPGNRPARQRLLIMRCGLGVVEVLKWNNVSLKSMVLTGIQKPQSAKPFSADKINFKVHYKTLCSEGF